MSKQYAWPPRAQRKIDMLYFTADQHYYHKNIIKYCNRPFKDAREMNEELIRLHNEVVQSEDTVIIVGDFGLASREKLEKIVHRLNGTKHLVLGNHDTYRPHTYLDIGFASVHTLLPIGDTPFITSPVRAIVHHDPALAVIDESVVSIVGHVHGLFKQARNAINVGVDIWGYKPVSAETVAEIVGDWCVPYEILESTLAEIDYITQDRLDDISAKVQAQIRKAYRTAHRPDAATQTGMYDRYDGFHHTYEGQRTDA